MGNSAAFFDLDKTVIARASMVAFGGPFRRHGLLSRRLLLRALWGQLVYLQLGADEGIDLDASYAYSDSATDLPMLEVVGHPVAVNPDRELARVARERAWEVRQFVQPVRLRDRVPVPPAAPAAVGGGVLAATAAGALWWWLRQRPPTPPLPSRWDRAFAAATRRAPSLPRRHRAR